jgi:flagella basal body P-ring formation protein FlgA
LPPTANENRDGSSNLDESPCITSLTKARDFKVPEGKLLLNYGRINNPRGIGRISLTLLVKVDEKFIKRLRVIARVGVYQDVVKIVNALQRGNVIRESDIVIERTRTERLIRNTPTALDKVIGQAATRNLQAGNIVKFRDLKKVPTIKRGARVIILARKGSMKITASGTAREDGFKNSIIQVINLETKKTIYAEVINSKTVEVSF